MLKNKRIILELNQPLAVVALPFRAPARRLGISQKELLAALRRYKRSGLIRRFGAVLAHRKIGLKANVLVAWEVEPRLIERSGRILAACAQISHCYQRRAYAAWPYNLYSMLHCPDPVGCAELVRKLARRLRARSFCVLSTVKELKKTKANLKEML